MSSQPEETIVNKVQQTGTLDPLAVVGRHVRWLFLASLLGIVAGVAYYYLLPPRYESEAELLLMQNDSGAMAAGTTSEENGISEELLATHIKLIQSSRIVGKALNRSARDYATSGQRNEQSSERKLKDLESIRSEIADEVNEDDSAIGAVAQRLGDKLRGELAKVTRGQEGSAQSSDEEAMEVASDAREVNSEQGVDYRLTEQERYDNAATAYVIDNMSVSAGGGGRARNAHVINIAFRHSVPEEARWITHAIVDEYQAFVRSKFQDINFEAAGLIDNARKELEGAIETQDGKYREFRKSAPLLSRSAEGADVHTTRYEELAAEYSQLALKRDEAAGRLAMVQAGLEKLEKDGAHNLQKLALIDDRNAERLGILVGVERGKSETAAFQATQPERMAGATAEYESLLTMRTRLKQLSEDFGKQHPEVKALTQQIAEMESFLNERSKALEVTEDIQLSPDDVLKAYTSMLKHDLDAIEQRAKDVERQMLEAETQAKELVRFQLADESLVRARERLEELYGAVTERLRTINLQDNQSPVIQELILEPTMGKKVEPKGVVAVALSLLTTLIIGGVGVLVAEVRDRSVHTPEEFEQLLGSRVLAHLPNFDKDNEIRQAQHRARQGMSPLSPSLLTYFAPNSRASESFRALRTQVMFALGGEHKTLMVTSSNQGAGKSMLASNIAVSIASSGNSVLLIDCDMRLPQVHRLFGISNDRGWADAIERPSDTDQLIVCSPIAGLSLLPSGRAPANPAEMLSRPECAELLQTLRQKYAYVILDCPPVLAVSDPSILAPLADGMLFVSVVDKESRPKTARAKKILEGVGAKITGIVVNRSDQMTQRYGYQAYGYESTHAADKYFDAASAK